ncbi:hypothetical protein BDR06DRAFT_975126 [Suillus hirtellus]|nr:hypothetical protein BDR06DRAFT_975126 [Suillus hirtellus]
MSSSEHANEALNLVADKIQQIIKKSEKLSMGDSGSKTLAHEIAVTLDTRICSHPLFNKTIGYMRPVPLASPPPVAAPIHTHPAAQASNSTPSEVALALFPMVAPVPPPLNPIAKPFNLLILGNKWKAPTSKLDDEDEEPVPPLAKHLVSKSGHEVLQAPQECSRPRKKVKLKKIISEDEDDEVLLTNVIYVKYSENINNSRQNKKQPKDTVPVVAPSAGAKPSIDTVKKPESSARIFSNQCEHCIKYDVACMGAAAKKAGKIWKCCCTCDEKKTKCVWLDPAAAELLCAQIALKKAKASAAADKKSRLAGPTGDHATHATSHVCHTSPDPVIASNMEDSADEDAEGNYDTQPKTLVTKAPADAEARPAAVAPAATVDNDVDMIVTPDVMPTDIIAPVVPMIEPTLNNIIWTIEVLRTRFEAMVTHSSDCAKALHEDMVGRTSTLDGEWTRRFVAMEAKIWDVELKNSSNMASIGHMANAMSMFHHTGRPTSFNPPAGPSTQGHPFGQILGSWFLNVPEPVDQSVSAVGKEYTTAWDLSHSPQPGPSANMNVSPVRASSEPLQLPHDVYSFPPANAFNSQ